MVTGLRASASSARSGWAAMQKSARISETIRVMVIALRWADDGTATSRASLPMGCRSEISLHFFGLDGASGFDRNKGKPKMRSEEHTSELQSLMRISYAVFCLKKKKREQ